MRDRFEGILVDGRSLGGIATTLAFPEMALTVDIGVCTPAALRTATVAITHTHADHVAGLHQYLAIRRLYGMAAPRLIAPKAALPILQSHIEVIGALQGRPFEPEVIGLGHQDECDLGRNLVLRAFEVTHSARIPCLGYVVLRRQKKLKQEYRGLNSAEIIRLKDKADLFELRDDPLVAVTGDAVAGAFSEPLAQRARVLFMECTFVGGGRDVEAAHVGGHVHLNELVPLLSTITSPVIVLYHFSQIYRSLELQEHLNARLPAEELRRVRFLLPEEGDRM